MSDQTYVAELLNGQVYYAGSERFDHGFPKEVSSDMAAYLESVVDEIPLIDGRLIAQKKFKITLVAKTEAEELTKEAAEAAKEDSRVKPKVEAVLEADATVELPVVEAPTTRARGSRNKR